MRRGPGHDRSPPVSVSRTAVVVIPAFNEVETIAVVISSVLEAGYEAVVVDDGSTDGTGEQARAAGAMVVPHPENRGYDAALATGLRRAAALADVVVTLDADAQHDPSAIASLVDPIVAGDADMSVGIRPRLPRFSERLFARHGRARHAIPDPLCGMKALRSTLIVDNERALDRPSIGCGMVMACQRSGARVTSVPIPVRERVGSSRFGTGIKVECRIIAALVECVARDLAFRFGRDESATTPWGGRRCSKLVDGVIR